MVTDQDINLVDLDIYQRAGAPHEQFTWLREHAPVFWHADGGGAGWPGFWAVTKHGDVAQVTRHPEIFSSARRTAVFKEWPDLAVERLRLMMINMDPPQHTRQRAFVNRGFTPRIIGRLEEHITEICSRLLDDIADSSDADFVTEIAAPLPTQVICELVGAPAEDRSRIFALSNRVVGFDDPEMTASPADQMQAVAEMYAYAGELADSRRKQPRDDIVTQLLQPDEAGPGTDHAGVQFLLPAADGRGQRDHSQRSVRWHARLLRPPWAVAEAGRRPGSGGISGGGDCPLGQPGEPRPPHCDLRYRAERPANRRRRQGGGVPHLSQPGRGRLRRGAGVRHRT